MNGHTSHDPGLSVNILRTILASIAAAMTCGPLSAGVPTDPLINNEMMMRTETPAQLSAYVAAAAATFDDVAIIDGIDGRPIHKLRYRLRAGQDYHVAASFCDAQVSLGVATWAELNYAGQSGEGRTDSFWISQFGLDPGVFADQYAGGVIGLPASRGQSLGQGTLIAVLDTGVDASHPAFEGRVLPGGASFIPGAGFADGANGADDDGDGLVDEQVGHGTFVAGMVHLVAPRAWILPVTVLNSDGVGDLWTIAKGMAFALDRGADVINLSLGSTYSSALIEDLADEASVRGSVVVAAMGNMAREDPEEFPAALGSVLAVCATDPDDLLATFSNFNPKADMTAPGATSRTAAGAVIVSRAIVGPVPGNRWAAWQGTSFATALASGAAALVRSQHPEWPNASVTADLMDDQVIARLTATALPIDAINPGYEQLIGRGRLAAGAATAGAPAAPREGDINLDGAVNGFDLGLLLGSWGQSCTGCRADVNRDGVVNGFDLGLLLGNWG